MKNAYRMFKRNNGYFYIQNNENGEQRSLETKDHDEAKRLLDAQNQARQSPALNRQLGKVYLTNADPKLGERTWSDAMNELASHGVESSQQRCRRALNATEFDLIRNKLIIETTSEDLKGVLKRGGNATNNYMRRLHNLALGNGWINWHIIPPKQWEKPTHVKKRAITAKEHERIMSAEQNLERRNYYEMLWHIGAAQTDGALLMADNIDWKKRVISYQRKKTKEWATIGIGKSLQRLLEQLPAQGFLFPHMASLRDKDRSAEFRRRCKILKIDGISLHSYRYAWAERAYVSAYPERYAQAALGHKSRAVHHAYAKNAQVICPPLEENETYEGEGRETLEGETATAFSV